MDGYLHRLLDVTIVYPDGVPTFWEFLQGRCPRVQMRVQPHVIPAELTDENVKRRPFVAQWVKELWVAKDRHLAEAMGAPQPSHAPTSAEENSSARQQTTES